MLNLRNAIMCVVGCIASQAAAAKSPNILFVAVDDLRPQVRAYGCAEAITPNIDRLASEGVRFDRAYVTYPLCLPSRASMLTGVRLDYNRGTGEKKRKRSLADLIDLQATWPRTFREAGYWTATAGKIYHGNVPENDESAWDVPGPMVSGGPVWSPGLMTRVAAQGGRKDQLDAFVRSGTGGSGALVWQSIDGDDESLLDGRTATKIIGYLKDRPKDKPFLICAGFAKPHMPWLAPKKYFDMYPPDAGQLARVPPGAERELLKQDRGQSAGGDAAFEWNEGVTDDEARMLVRGYMASLTYSDAQVGRLLDALKELGLERDTIVVLWGDHGYHLTDHGLWRKNTIYHVASRIPFTIRAPGLARGKSTSAIVESIDIYPTLLGLTGIGPGKLDLHGRSLAPLLKDPATPWPHPAYTSAGDYHGIVTDRYRFAVSPTQPRTLFDLQADPGEWKDLADDPQHADLVKDLEARTRSAWAKAR